MPTPSPVPGRAVVLSASWCPYCRHLLADLEADGVPHDVVDVDVDEEAAEFVREANGGDRVVPTVLLPDGTTLTNPPAAAVRARLGQ